MLAFLGPVADREAPTRTFIKLFKHNVLFISTLGALPNEMEAN